MPPRILIPGLRSKTGVQGSGRTKLLGRQGGTGPVQLLDAPAAIKRAGGMTKTSLPGNISAALDAIAGSTVGNLLVRDTNGWDGITAGSSGKVLTANGAAALPSWQAASGGSGPSLTRLQRTTTFSLSNVTDTPISWNTTAIEDDVSAFAAGSPTQLKTPASGFTRVAFSAYVIYASTGTNLWLWITQNGTEVCRFNWQGVNEGGQSCVTPYLPTAAADIWVVHLFQNSGGALTVGNSPRWPLWQASWLP